MTWPPESVKIVSTPCAARACATSRPPCTDSAIGAIIPGDGSRPGLPRHIGLRADGEPEPRRAARAARRRPAAVRLRRGHPAPALALVGRAPRPRRDLPHALPRRPFPRATGDAQDLCAPRPRGAVDDLRAARAAGAVRLARARLREASVPARPGGDDARGRARPRRPRDPAVPDATRGLRE